MNPLIFVPKISQKTSQGSSGAKRRIINDAGDFSLHRTTVHNNKAGHFIQVLSCKPHRRVWRMRQTSLILSAVITNQRRSAGHVIPVWLCWNTVLGARLQPGPAVQPFTLISLGIQLSFPEGSRSLLHPTLTLRSLSSVGLQLSWRVSSWPSAVLILLLKFLLFSLRVPFPYCFSTIPYN